MSRKKTVYGNWRQVNDYALLRAYGKAKIDGVQIRNKSIEEHLYRLSWHDAPRSHPERSWKYQTKCRKQWMHKTSLKN
jgi:hypothetical protein